jgi:hypothetical protein
MLHQLLEQTGIWQPVSCNQFRWQLTIIVLFLRFILYFNGSRSVFVFKKFVVHGLSQFVSEERQTGI